MGLDDDAILDSALAVKSWDEKRDWDGRNYISRATGSQRTHETLYLSRRGRYWVEHTSQWQGFRPSAQLLTKQEAIAWLALNDHGLPAELTESSLEVIE